ncbi:SGNH/GDSL hydrolase family protein [Pararobbsia silviterrae]|uniref:Acylhydrolase n=1 Tax=Pararobbsia silviterrae TaxID=1792498 RepID=A0A494YE52_9BURK|nr:SGNH/GDSL hydrolase family protein [Pararobbsia silviterrae]RKP58998.1 acylhydrolase [Pararobbsia silviterrae]
MKFSPKSHQTARRMLQAAAAVALTFSVVACGGGGSDSTTASTLKSQVNQSFQVVSFGDSLSDVGTYAPNIELEFGASGRFTTSPGQVWTQEVATYYGDTLTPAETGGFGATITQYPNGYGYAQGGALISGTEGNGWEANGAAALTVPVTQQVTNYLTTHGSFNSNQLVLIQGGANDLIQFAEEVSADPTQLANASTVIQAAVTAFVTDVGTILAKGATHVVVVNIPDISQTPLATLANDGGATAALFQQLVTGFNTALSTALTANFGSAVVQVDSATFIDNAVTNYQANGFSVSNTATACNLTQMYENALASGLSTTEAASFESSLFCSPQLYVAANADQTYMFADQIHPTTHLHALFAAYVESQINTAYGLTAN